jgi:hypothetical protein
MVKGDVGKLGWSDMVCFYPCKFCRNRKPQKILGKRKRGGGRVRQRLSEKAKFHAVTVTCHSAGDFHTSFLSCTC